MAHVVMCRLNAMHINISHPLCISQPLRDLVLICLGLDAYQG